MSTRLLLAVADEGVRAFTQVALAELPDVELTGTVATSSDVMAVIGGDIDIVLLHPSVGPMPYLAICRELSSRRPDIAVGLLFEGSDSETLARAMEVGVRSVLSANPTVAELQTALAPMLDWVRSVRALSAGRAGAANVARMVTFVGAKGGVGTSTVALHMALLAAKADRTRRVCLVDLDLQQGGLAHLLDVTPRRTIADLALVAEGISGRNIDESVFVHRSSLRLLPAPKNGEQAEDVDARAARQILAAVKGHYDVVVVDAGSVLSEVGATALELSDDVFLVTTADVAALRAGRDKVRMLARLHVRKEDEILTIVNRVSPKQEVQPDLARRVVGTEITRVSLPADWHRLQTVTNSAQPEDLEDGPFRRAITALTRDVGLLAAPSRAAAAPAVATNPMSAKLVAPKRGRRRGSSRAGAEVTVVSDAGQIAPDGLVGNVGALLVAVVLLPVVAIGIAGVYASKGADAAALAGSRASGSAQLAADAAVDDKLPGWLSHTVTIQTGTDPDNYRVEVSIPMVVPGLVSPTFGATASASN